jgi:hypothetical protein
MDGVLLTMAQEGAYIGWCNMNCVATRIEHKPEAPAQINKNWILRFSKSEGPVLSGPAVVMGTTRLQREAPPPAKYCLDDGEA